jgi:hypothetical protein
MWAVVVEVGTLCRHQIAGMVQGVEQVLIQGFIPHASIEAFDESILHWLAADDVVPVDLTIFLPLQDCATGQLSSITPSE